MVGVVLLHEALDAVVDMEKPAIVDRAGFWTYAELKSQSHAAAAWLLEQGIGVGDRIMVGSTGERHLVALLYGCSRVGAVLVPVGESLKPYQLSQIVDGCEPSIVIGLEEAAGNRGGLGELWAGDLWREDHGAPMEGPSTNDPLIIFYTSGSTAAPKGVVAPHAQISFVVGAIQERLGYRESDVIFSRLPLNFDYGLYQIFLSVVASATLILGDPRDDPGLAVDVERLGVTILPIVPALGVTLARLASRGEPIGSVRLITNTGEELPASTIARLKSAFPAAAVQLMYGLTECKRVSILEPDGYRWRPGSVGRPLSGTSVEIVDERGCVVGPGVQGQIIVYGPHVMAGYWQSPDASDRLFGWDEASSRALLRTGDMGYLDEEGYLYFTGRRDQLFKHRGIRTSVAEIEAAAMLVAGVEEVTVVPSEGGGPLLIYAVTELTPAEVLRGLEALIGRQKLPDACNVVGELPHGPTGKVDRVALRLRATRESAR